jgi:hypothetical protein
MSGDWMAKFNTYEHKRYLKLLETTFIDAMSEPFVFREGEEHPDYFAGHGAMNFWVNVPKQPVDITVSVKKIVGNAMPAGYNNIAIYSPWGVWGLKYMCC